MPRVLIFFLLAQAAFIFCAAQTAPAPRHLEQVCYDSHRQQMVLFGGGEVLDQGFYGLGYVAEWDGTKWKKIGVPGPSGRRGHALVYDTASRLMLMIGGVMGIPGGDSVLFDSWAWNGENWKRINNSCPVKEPRAVYDPQQKRILVYGEISNKHTLRYDGIRKFELWQFKTGQWKKLAADGPVMRGAWTISFDISRNTLIIPLLDGENRATWEWNNKWKTIPCNENCPPARNRYALAYAPGDQLTYLYGGLNEERQQLADHWKWDGQQWKILVSDENPGPRNSAHFAVADSALILYGGSIPQPGEAGKITLSNDIWLWKQGRWTRQLIK